VSTRPPRNPRKHPGHSPLLLLCAGAVLLSSLPARSDTFADLQLGPAPGRQRHAGVPRQRHLRRQQRRADAQRRQLPSAGTGALVHRVRQREQHTLRRALRPAQQCPEPWRQHRAQVRAGGLCACRVHQPELDPSRQPQPDPRPRIAGLGAELQQTPDAGVGSFSRRHSGSEAKACTTRCATPASTAHATTSTTSIRAVLFASADYTFASYAMLSATYTWIDGYTVSSALAPNPGLGALSRALTLDHAVEPPPGRKAGCLCAAHAGASAGSGIQPARRARQCPERGRQPASSSRPMGEWTIRTIASA
jgi:hypothetical protein